MNNLTRHKEISIIHANSNVLMHHGLRKVCEGGGVSKIQQVESEKELMVRLSEEHYEIMVIDPRKEHGFDIESVHRIQEELPATKILIISDIKNEASVLKILENGVQGYLTYECDADEIVHAIFSIAKGEKFYCNKVLDIVFNKHLYKKEMDDCEATNLTSRETEIAEMIARGMSNKEVAEAIHLSPHTVHTHRKNIMKKLGVRSASELTIYAISTGLIKA